VGAAEGHELIEGGGVLHAFGNDVQAHGAAHADDPGHDGTTARLAFNASHEAAVDLELVGW